MIPLLHDFTNETVLIFGGGPVGARKARRFAREARVIVVSPAFADREFGGAERVRAAPDPADVPAWLERTEPALVVAATDDAAVNEAVADAARERGALVNRADRSGERDVGSVVVPATVREDPVTVAVATGGTAPALSKYLREELEETLSGAGEMARVCGELRAELKARDVPAERRRAIVTDVVNSPDLWTALRTGTSNCAQVIEDVFGEERSGGDRT
ncbi:bifunctional precorrin-2 dehydrogenase/sirohydrochlorin ferrochelatase [Natrinema thermotolerans]|uniref:precorrin-2 dehydrogenase n=1 Tax=Natrinema thermotolerans TaxID=121872 RepID=A0AAF0P870_9EURY|nr:bifunctional precorrin-2 dehydrogenase/sirohydrochlorin ferrochelatase [Natrinema thermotolerans]QCC59328.1 bifunctional precorrin-2 dehydrogenase/sirohydrochlorin ferrochelatase [Natrinema thermotolerans]WMT06297.1 bifunctional precorrin-2 dehydrogenase/sirohydrochlorin ferrochelatase [Natrinema thermotolerans]